jgi:hypothetical protein
MIDSYLRASRNRRRADNSEQITVIGSLYLIGYYAFIQYIKPVYYNSLKYAMVSWMKKA